MATTVIALTDKCFKVGVVLFRWTVNLDKYYLRLYICLCMYAHIYICKTFKYMHILWAN